MAIKRTLSTVSGPIDAFETAATKYILGADFQPEQTASYIHVKRLQPFPQDNPFADLMQRALSLATELDIPVDGLSGKGAKGNTAAFTAYMTNLSRRLDALQEKRRKTAEIIEQDRQAIEILSHIQGVDENMERFFHLEAVEFRFGRMKQVIYNRMKDRIEARTDTLFIPTSIEEDVYAMYFVLPSHKELADAFFSALRFERIYLPETIRGTPAQAAELFQLDLDRVTRASAALEDELRTLTLQERQPFSEHYRYGLLMNEVYSLRAFAAHTEQRFYIVGRIPQIGAEAFARTVEQEPGFSCVLA